MSWLHITDFPLEHQKKKRCFQRLTALLCISALLQYVSACIHWGSIWVNFNKASHLNSRRLRASDEAMAMRLSLVYNHIGGLLYHWALQFSTFPDEWYSKAYFHSHIINTFPPTPASNIAKHFRQCAHAILGRHERRRWGEELRQPSDVAAERFAELY